MSNTFGENYAVFQTSNIHPYLYETEWYLLCYGPSCFDDIMKIFLIFTYSYAMLDFPLLKQLPTFSFQFNHSVKYLDESLVLSVLSVAKCRKKWWS